MNPKQFKEFLCKTTLTCREKDKAWKLYKKESSLKALEFIEKVEIPDPSLQQLKSPVPWKIWGEHQIEKEALEQMQKAASLPVALAAALMPDAHMGYGLPIGGILATENSVIPYAVGVDIACRMKISIYANLAEILKDSQNSTYSLLYTALLNNSLFGSGPQGMHAGKIEHPLLEKEHWQFSSLAGSLRQTAIHQIGTSGGGNHFVEWGILEISTADNLLNLAQGKYLALLSHSGSRGVGFKIANYYTKIAMARLKDLDSSVKHLAWLPLDQDIGQESWQSMHLAGEFAAAFHEVIHQRISTTIGLTPLATVENPHNFAWKEKIFIDGKEKEAIVHRKGATPAGKGVLGIIPGTMADPGYVVIGKGHRESLNSASHGSGRKMARSRAKKVISPKQYRDYLSQHGVDLIGGTIEEAPQAYKAIFQIMEEQKDLVDILGIFQPKIVRMASQENMHSSAKLPFGIIEGE